MPSNLACAFTAGLLCSLYYYLRPRRIRYPPGPPGYPIVGNLLGVPLKYPWRKFASVAADNGDIIYYHGLGNSILVLNSQESILDLLVHKGNTYASRPFFVVATELMDLVKSTALIPFCRSWRLHRKFSRIALSTDMVKRYEGTLSDIANILTDSLKNSPEEFVDHVRLAAGRVIMSTIYGIDVQSADDPYISIAEAAMSMISKAVLPGAFLVDLLPALKHLPEWTPFTTFHKAGREGRILVAELIEKPFEYVKRGIEDGSARQSFTMDVLTSDDFNSDREQNGEFETTLKWASASMYAAGQEVVSSSLLNMIMAMATNPEKLKIAQAELKKVVGSRTITIEDRENLPYVHAIIKETLRWHPPLPMSIARSLIEEDVYRGYVIPKDTIVIPNVWAIAHAPNEQYPPDEFWPERFLGDSTVIDPATYCFGFGRRICPGRMLAENAMFLMTANVLRSFDIAHSIDENGQEIPIAVEYSSGLVSLPETFQCTITPSASI